MADYLAEECSRLKYTGVDINPKAVEGVLKLHPNSDFRVADILERDLGEFDYVVSSGLFCVNTGENCKKDTKRLLQRMAETTKKYMAANFMDASKCSFFEGHLNYEYPEDVREFLSNFGEPEIIRDYPLWEFTARLRR